jgi:hypothetical protein
VFFKKTDSSGAPSTLSSQVESIFFDPKSARDSQVQLRSQVVEYAIVGLAVLFLAIYEWLRSIFPNDRNPWFVISFTLAIAVYAGIRLALLWPKLKTISADQKVWSLMELDFSELGQRGYLLFDGLHRIGGGTVPPLLIGPGGLFVLSVKTNQETGGFRQKITHTADDRLLINGRPALADPLGQAKLAVRRVQTWLSEHDQGDITVRALIIYPGWNVEKGRAQEAGDIIVTNEREMVNEIMRYHGQVLSAAQVIGLAELLQSSQKN